MNCSTGESEGCEVPGLYTLPMMILELFVRKTSIKRDSNTLSIKIEYVDKLRENKNIIKKYKIAPLTEIENYLVNENMIDVKTFLILCILEELSVLYLRKNTYYELSFVSSDTHADKQHVVVCHSPFKYTYECEKTPEEIQTYKNTYYKLDQIDKPVKGFSSYKLPELVDISNKLSLDVVNRVTLKKKTKQELYESIIQYF